MLDRGDQTMDVPLAAICASCSVEASVAWTNACPGPTQPDAIM
jgi:hypothetical protein